MRFISCHNGKLQTLTPQEFRAPANQAFVTGLPALDALLPGGGFSRGSVHEILSEPQNGNALFFASLLVRSSLASADSGGTHRCICWCDPGGEIYPPALANQGIAFTHLLLLQPGNPRDMLWAISESLRCRGVAAVVAAPPRLSRITARRLQLSAERGGGVGLLLRNINAPGIDCYAAATRWLVRPEPGESALQRWNVQLIHGHGGSVGQSVILEVRRENFSVSARGSLQTDKTLRAARAS